MVFVKGSNHTREAARRGGKSGVKYLQKLSPQARHRLAVKAGRLGGAASVKARRAKKLKTELKKTERSANKKVDKIMSGYTGLESEHGTGSKRQKV